MTEWDVIFSDSSGRCVCDLRQSPSELAQQARTPRMLAIASTCDLKEENWIFICAVTEIEARGLPIPNPQLLILGSASAAFLERLSRSPVHDPRPWSSHEAGRTYTVHTLAHRDEQLQAQGI